MIKFQSNIKSVSLVSEFGDVYRVVEWDDGMKFWYLPDVPEDVIHATLHRACGPAIERPEHSPSFMWLGCDVTEEVQEQGIDQLSPEDIKFWLPILAARTTSGADRCEQ